MSVNNIKYILKVLIAVFIFSFLVDKLVYFGLNKLNAKVYSGQGAGKLNQFLKIKDSVNLLVFGSSRANHNVDNIRLDSNSFNMGVDGRSIAYFTTLIKLLSSRPQILLIQMDPENACDNTYTGNDIEPLKALYNKNNIVKAELDKLNLSNPFQNIYWSISYNAKVFGMLSNSIRPKYDYTKYYGYDPIEVTNDQRIIFENILKEKKEDTCAEKLVLNRLFYNYLQELKQTATTKNKKLIFFTSPVYADRCKSDNEFLSKLMKANELAYFDFSDFFKSNNSLNYWKDEIHLSGIGASLFTDSLKNILAGK